MAPNMYNDWICGACKFDNFERREQCKKCGGAKPKAPSQCRKGQCQWGKGEPLAAKIKSKLEKELEAKWEKERASLKKKTEQLERELASSKKQLVASKKKGGVATDVMEVEVDDSEAEVKSQVSKLRDQVRALEGLDLETQALVDAEDKVAALNAQIQGLLAGVRESRPLQQRLDDQARFVQKRQNALSQARARLDKADQTLKELQEKRLVLQTAADQAESEHATALDELNRIRASCATQLVLDGGQAPSGYILIAEAERIYQEEVAKVHLGYAQAVDLPDTKDGDASEAVQSDIGDAFDVDDVEGWQKMEKGKRKSTLERSGRLVANKVKKLSKGATPSSPFAKARAADRAKGAEGGKQ